MANIAERKAAILTRIGAIKTEKAEAVTLAERLQQRFAEAEQLATSLRAELSIAIWAELDSGASIAVGDRVRYMLKVYECTTAHTKALTRRPTVETYWREVS
jgi:hypothetical protein